MTTATIKTRTAAKAWQAKHDPLAPRAGDLAPGFELTDIHGTSTVRLSDFRGKQLK